ncbi:MAG: class I SAM-dependent methyltransferase [Candidatus Eiseniibacteriota bacterium]|jgi:SAM-dependent methyltransferase
MMDETPPTAGPADGKATSCPSCDGTAIETIYTARSIPVHSCILMGSRDEAVGYPRGDLELAFCDSCGFVFNRVFDRTVHEYSHSYEETQGFSPTFGAFARSLAERLDARFALRGKTVLEIGCGKGEFLAQLCALADCQGIGLDPSYVPGRLPDDLARRVRFIEDFYGPAYAHLEADLVCCRHTLEHIDSTGAFVADLHTALAARPATPVFFEVPDARRVLQEGAFWDIYYEHCSYFSAGSHARLFRRAGFDVLDLELAYAGQYILQTAVHANGGAPVPPAPLEDDLSAMRAAAAAFPATVRLSIERWHDQIERARRRGRRVVIWGSGSKGVAFLTTLGLGDAVEHVVDINPHRHGRFMPGTGQEIIAPERLATLRPELVIVMNPVYVDEISADLERLGVSAEVRAV